MIGASTLCAASPQNCCTSTDRAITRRKGKNKIIETVWSGNTRDFAGSFNWEAALLIS